MWALLCPDLDPAQSLPGVGYLTPPCLPHPQPLQPGSHQQLGVEGAPVLRLGQQLRGGELRRRLARRDGPGVQVSRGCPAGVFVMVLAFQVFARYG